MPPDRDHFNGSVSLDDAGPVMREIVSPIPVGRRRIPDRETIDQADWIFFQLRKFLQRTWLVPARPQPGPPAGLTVDPGTEPGFAFVPDHPAGQITGALHDFGSDGYTEIGTAVSGRRARVAHAV